MSTSCIKIIKLSLVVFILEMCSGQLPLVINTWPLPDATSAGIFIVNKIILVYIKGTYFGENLIWRMATSLT